MTTVTATGTSSPIVVPGLSAGNYTFSVKANNGVGASASSATSSVVAVSAPTAILPTGGPTGKNWNLVFDDEFPGTSLDTSKWNTNYSVNGVSTSASNCTVSGGVCTLQLSSTSVGVEICSNNTYLPIGGFVEFYAWFSGPGSTPGTQVDNWSAVWTSGPGWPAAGEFDVAECGGNQLGINYHYKNSSGNNASQGYGSPSGNWSNSWHTYGVYRGSGQTLVYWDGALKATINTQDNGAQHSIIANVGNSNNNTTVGPSGALKLQYVRAWNPA